MTLNKTYRGLSSGHRLLKKLGFFTYFGTVVISYAVSHLPHKNIWPLLATLLVESVMCVMVYLLRPSECEGSLT